MLHGFGHHSNPLNRILSESNSPGRVEFKVKMTLFSWKQGWGTQIKKDRFTVVVHVYTLQT